MATWYLGVDPGLGETGLCLLDSSLTVRAAATIKAAGPSRPDLERYARLAHGVAQWANERKFEIATGALVVCIETPVLNSTNVTNYRKQASTVAVIEYVLMRDASVDAIVEVNPTEVKYCATGHGNATKGQVILASPFRNRMAGPTTEALADAWAVALAGRIHEDRIEQPQMRGTYPIHEEVNP